MEKNEIETKLVNSDAVKSLSFERKVKGILEKLKWDVIHSPYYLDVNTGKLREIDLIGGMIFKRNFQNETN